MQLDNSTYQINRSALQNLNTVQLQELVNIKRGYNVTRRNEDKKGAKLLYNKSQKITIKFKYKFIYFAKNYGDGNTTANSVRLLSNNYRFTDFQRLSVYTTEHSSSCLLDL